MKNKIIISIDGIRKDRLGCYNHKYKNITPNLTAIADECVRFDDMMASATSTGMCFASIFTGRYAVEFGRKTYGDTYTPFTDNVFSDHEKLGYKTVVCLNKRFDVHARLVNSFSEAEFWWTGTTINESETKTKDDSSLRPLEQARYFIERADAIDGPFLAWIHLWGFSSPEKRFSEIIPFEYDARVAELDEAVGAIFEHFSGSSEMFIMADHGYALFEQGRWAYGKDGHCLTEPVISVPALVFNGMKGANPNLVSQTRLREIILDSSNARDVKDETAYCETRYIEQPDIALAVRRGRFKLVYDYSGRHSFYDLYSDPYENIDYAGNTFHKLQRSGDGTHPQLKPYILRTDWEHIKTVEQELLGCARAYYGPSFFSWERRLRRMRHNNPYIKHLDALYAVLKGYISRVFGQ